MSAENPVRLVRARDGSSWCIGTDADVAWIAAGTSVSRTITAAIPPVFEAYATIVVPSGSEDQDKHDQAVLALLSEQSPGSRGGWDISTLAPMTLSSPVRQW